MTATGRKLARKIIYCQFAVVLIATGLFAIMFGKYGALSSLLGGFSCLLPNLIFAYFAFKYVGASQNKLVVRAFTRGLNLKFLTTSVLFVLAFQWPHLQMLPLIICYIVTVFAQWPIILIISRVKT